MTSAFGQRPHIIGLTGSIGMGKSTTAAMFADLGAAIWDADGAVHRLYARGGAAVAGIGAAFPGAVRDGAIDRAALAARIADDPAALPRIEAIVHPLVAADRAAFLRDCRADIAVLDIPLLFETGADAQVDTTVVVTAPPQVQRARVLARPGITAHRLSTLLARQLPDAEKRRRADHVVATDTMDGARRAVLDIVTRIRQAQEHA